MTSPHQAADVPLARFALSKMSNVLGADRARQLYKDIIDDPGRTVETPEELFVLGEELRRLGGFEAAVGAMLQVNAVMRGARGR